MQAFTPAVIERACGVPSEDAHFLMRAMAMYDHEVVIALTIMSRCRQCHPEMTAGALWTGCCVLACKLHDEENILPFRELAQVLECRPRDLSAAESTVLDVLQWRIPIDKNDYLRSYKALLGFANEPRIRTCTDGCFDLIFPTSPPKE